MPPEIRNRTLTSGFSGISECGSPNQTGHPCGLPPRLNVQSKKAAKSGLLLTSTSYFGGKLSSLRLTYSWQRFPDSDTGDLDSAKGDSVPIPCNVLVILHKTENSARIVVSNQPWVILEEYSGQFIP